MTHRYSSYVITTLKRYMENKINLFLPMFKNIIIENGYTLVFENEFFIIFLFS